MGSTLSDVKVRGHFRQLRAFYNWAFKHRILDRAFYIELPEETKKDPRPYYPDELLKLRLEIIKSIESAARKNHRLCRTNDLRALIFASYTGFRRGVIWSLLLKHINLDRGIIEIRKNLELGWNPKKLKERDKPIPDHLIRYLETDLKNRDEKERYYLDNGYGQPCYDNPAGLTKAFQRHKTSAGLSNEIKPFKAIRNFGSSCIIVTYNSCSCKIENAVADIFRIHYIIIIDSRVFDSCYVSYT